MEPYLASVKRAYQAIDDLLVSYAQEEAWESLLEALEYGKDGMQPPDRGYRSSHRFLDHMRNMSSSSPGTVIIDIGALTSGTVVFLIQAKQGPLRPEEVVWIPDWGREQLQAAVSRWMVAPLLDSFNAEVVDSTLATLSDALWARVRPFLPSETKRVVFIPHLALRALPLHALWYTDQALTRYVIDEFEVSYAPSAVALYAAMQRSRDVHITSAAAIADIKDPSLRFAEAEIAEVTKYFPEANLVIDGNDLDKDHVLKALRTSSLVHFACHGRFVAEEPRRSYLHFNNQYLDMTDLPALDKGTEAPLAIALLMLSACETGVQVIDSIVDYHSGLIDSFLKAGVATVVGTLWPSTEAPTLILMREFYASLLKEHLRPAAAMQRAVRSLRATVRYDVSGVSRHRPHGFCRPFDWANFIVVGAW